MKRSSFGLLLALPSIAFLFVIMLYPLLYSLFFLSLYSLNILNPEASVSFVGLENYSTILRDVGFSRSLVTTSTFTIAVVSVEFLLGLSLSLALNQELRGKNAFRVLVLFPVMIAPVAVGIVWRWMFVDQYGIINFVLENLGINGPLWLSDPSVALLSVMLVDIWQNTPFMALILLAGLQAIPRDLYEAVNMDGASRWQSTRYVTLPMLRSAILIALIIRTIDAFTVFDTIYVLTGGGPGGATGVLSIFIYKMAFYSIRIEPATAGSWIMVLMMLALSLIYAYSTRSKL